MIDIEKLEKFLDDANQTIKDSVGASRKMGPLCELKVVENGSVVLFSVECRGYVRDEEAFFLVVRLGDSTDKYISRGHFTAHCGHCTDFARTHASPRGMSIQQGLLIEMRGILARMQDCRIEGACATGERECAKRLLDELSKIDLKVRVVRDDATSSTAGVPDGTVGRLVLKSGKELEEQKKEASLNKTKRIEIPDDTVGREFAKSVGNREEKPDRDNPLDEALGNTQVYRVGKKTFWSRLMKSIGHLLGFDREREKLDSACEAMFPQEERDNDAEDK